ncbi:MAG TPA: AAA family ATPase [Candidatus Butyricicoccus avicola]|nr:AAA family ATPase [Candidatus Butyricicoccus avicola]
MDELEFARAYLGDFKIKGQEIVPRYCPYCKGGQHSDRETFALNMEKHTFKCLRGSCGKQGHFSELLRDFGAQGVPVYTPPVKRVYQKPPAPKVDTSGAVMDYIQTRGITSETAAAFGVGGNSKGEVVFPYYDSEHAFQDNAPCSIKYRPAHKLRDGESKARREQDTMPMLFGMHLCKPENGTLYVFEGEFDCMSGWQSHGGNCVSVPNGCNDFSWLETCADFLAGFSHVAVIGDNDEPGRGMVRKLADKLECAVFVPDFTLYGGCKDANEVLYRFGEERVCEIMDSTRPAEVLGLLNIAEVGAVDLAHLPRTLSGFPALDALTGGLYFGDLNVWTGRRGEGKSTVLTQIALEAIEQGYNVCVYSGEIPADRFKYGLYLQAAGSTHVCDYDDREAGRVTQYVPKTEMQRIDRWLSGRFWLYDNRISEADEAESVLKVFEKAYRRYDCRVFMVDNLMTVRACKREIDFYQAQADFCIRLRKFAERLGVIVHLVVHPRKTGGKAVTDNDEIGGLSTITNIACACFIMHRTDEDEAREYDCDATLSCTKNRAYGQLGNVALRFIPKSRRYVQRGEIEKAFGWEQIADETQKPLEEPPF